MTIEVERVQNAMDPNKPPRGRLHSINIKYTIYNIQSLTPAAKPHEAGEAQIAEDLTKPPLPVYSFIMYARTKYGGILLCAAFEPLFCWVNV